jgi:hypothetical protein
MAGALLFKPDMSHLTTYPDIYLPHETYIPLDWDGADLLEKTEFYLEHETERRRIARNAFEQYRQETARLGDRFEALLGEYS